MPVSRKLVIVESPAKAHSIEKFLGRNYKVEASQGHVRDLPKSRIGISPEDNFRMDYITIHGKGDLLAGLRKEVKKGFRELENTLNNTARTSDGNLNYVSGVDSESFIGKGWTIDA